VSHSQHTLPWLEAGQLFPPVEQAWGQKSDAPGLLCAGADLSIETLRQAYQGGIFPWFSQGQAILWWSPDPRMVLEIANFRLHPSLKKQVKNFAHSPGCEIRVDSTFNEVINACAQNTRIGQNGTWIVPAMVQAYQQLHLAGLVHSVEVWANGHLTGGLYFVAIGRAVFGESMFHRTTDASKIALAALVAMCRQFDIRQIDCQQNTRHLASLGAAEMPRAEFLNRVKEAAVKPEPCWIFSPVYWTHILTSNPVSQ
jgi:leucyl/phenylalanyl-tRNA--protein transferase